MESIRGDVERELGRFGPAAGMARVVSAWPSVVGETVARNAWPARIARDGTLQVATSSSAWAFELSQLAPTVLERLGAALGGDAPSALRFAPGRLPEPPGPSPTETTAPVPSPTAEERELGRAIASGIGDSELRGLVARAAAASLSRAASDR